MVFIVSRYLGYIKVTITFEYSYQNDQGCIKGYRTTTRYNCFVRIMSFNERRTDEFGLLNVFYHQSKWGIVEAEMVWELHCPLEHNDNCHKHTLAL